MSLLLPPSASPLRDQFEITDLVDLGKIPSFAQALNACRKTVTSEKAIRSASAVCLRASGEVWLIEVGKRGAWRRRWNFGDPFARVAA